MQRHSLLLAIASAILAALDSAAFAQFAWDGDCSINWHDCCQQGGNFVNNWTIQGNPAACPPLPGPSDHVSLSGVVDSQQFTLAVAGLVQSGTFFCRAQFLSILNGELTTFGSPLEPSTLQVLDGSIINIHPKCTVDVGSFTTFDVQNGFVRPIDSGGQVFTIHGTLTKTANPEALSEISVPIDNHGLITCATGTLVLSGGGTSSGLITPMPDTTIRLQGNVTFGLAGEVSGTGLLRFAGGTTNVTGNYHPRNTVIAFGTGYATVNFEVDTSIENLTIDNAGAVGGQGDLTVDDLICYGDPATINPGGTLIVQNTALFKGLYNNGSIGLLRDMELYGGTTIDSDSDLRMMESEVRNHGVLQLKNNGNIRQTCCVANSGLKNFGTLQKTSGGTSLINVIVSNVGGTIDVQSGTLHFDGDMASAGPIVVNAGATLRCGHGQQSLFPEGSITGSGTVAFAPVNAQPIVDVIEGEYDVNLTKVEHPGVVSFQNAATTAILGMAGGWLEGDGVLTVTEQLNWSNSTMRGAGVTRAEGSMQMVANTQGWLERTLEIDQSDRGGGCAGNSNGLMQIVSPGILRGQGAVDGHINNNGVVSPGLPRAPVGDLCITGNFSQDFFGELRIDLANPSSFDRVFVGGNATLGGKLIVTGGYTTNQSFTILTAASVSGAFGQFIAPPGMIVTYTPTTVVLQGAPGPDCLADIAPQPSGDGVVNVNDLLMVIGNWGATGTNPADITGDGVVGVADLLAVISAWGRCP